MKSEDSASLALRLVEQWPVEINLPNPSVMMSTGDGRLLIGDRSQDGCFLLDLNHHTCHREVWHQPERIVLQEQTGFLFPEKGIRDLSVSTDSPQPIAAVAAKGLFASCWHVGGKNGWVLDGEAHSVAVAPNGSSVAVGLGKWVLDPVSPAQAEVVIWDIPENEFLIRRKLPGACVVQLLWIHGEGGLIYDNIYNATAPRWLNELIIATTVTRNQSSGFVVLLDPVFLRILEIADIGDARNLGPIAAWPQEHRIWAGGFRDLGEHFHDPWIKANHEWAPKSSASHCRRIWLSEDRLCRLEYGSDDRLFVQILESISSNDEEPAEEFAP